MAEALATAAAQAARRAERRRVPDLFRRAVGQRARPRVPCRICPASPRRRHRGAAGGVRPAGSAHAPAACRYPRRTARAAGEHPQGAAGYRGERAAGAGGQACAAAQSPGAPPHRRWRRQKRRRAGDARLAVVPAPEEPELPIPSPATTQPGADAGARPRSAACAKSRDGEHRRRHHPRGDLARRPAARLIWSGRCRPSRRSAAAEHGREGRRFDL